LLGHGLLTASEEQTRAQSFRCASRALFKTQLREGLATEETGGSGDLQQQQARFGSTVAAGRSFGVRARLPLHRKQSKKQKTIERLEQFQRLERACAQQKQAASLMFNKF
jgi:hypothetical protein